MYGEILKFYYPGCGITFPIATIEKLILWDHIITLDKLMQIVAIINKYASF